MRNRIVTAVLAISLLATVFCALPAVKAEANYVGSVTTTDYYNVATDKFFESPSTTMWIYFNIQLTGMRWGLPDAGPVDVVLQRPDGTAVSVANNVQVRDPATLTNGWYNSSSNHAFALSTNVGLTQGVQAFYVVMYDSARVEEISRKSVLIMDESLSLNPVPAVNQPYYPGEDVSITLFTSQMAYSFYVQVLKKDPVTLQHEGDPATYTQENWTGQLASQGSWNHVWKVRESMPDGFYELNVRNASDHSYLGSGATPVTDLNTIDLWVNKYQLIVESERTHYMPGETANISYRTIETATGVPITGVSITYTAIWYLQEGWIGNPGGANRTWMNGTLTGSSGTQEFLIPADVNISHDVEITYWANESSRSATDDITLVISKLMGTLTVPTTNQKPGDTIVVTVNARIGDASGSENLPGAAVEVAVKWNGTAIAAYGSTSLTTAQTGSATHTFALNSSTPLGSYLVEAKITSGGSSITLKNAFNVIADGWLAVILDKDTYVTGEAATMSFRFTWNNEDVVVPNFAYVVTISGDVVATGNSTGEDVSVDIPENARGTMTVTTTANYKGNFRTGTDTASVVAARIALTTASDRYRPGDTITWQWQIVTSLTTAMLRYEVADSFSVKVASGDLVFALAGEFEFDVPTENVPASYTAKVILQTDTGVYLVSPNSQIQRLVDYELSIWIGRSGYTSGEFKPGSVIKMHFAITPRSGVDLPVYRIVVSADYDDTDKIVLTESPTGVIEYTIADDAPTGELWFNVYLYDGIAGGNSLDSEYSEILVNSRLSGWDKSVAGMSASDFTIMVLIIILILVLIVMPFVKARMGAAPKPAKVEPPPPTPP